MKIVHVFIFLLISALLSGCFGLTLHYPKSQEIEKYSIVLSREKVVPGYEGNPTKKDVLAMWGEPHKKYRKNGIEVWKYKHGFRWIGVVPVVGFALPLGIPILPAKTNVYFKDEKSIKIYFDYTASLGGVIAPDGYHSAKDYMSAKGFVSPEGYHIYEE